MHGVRNTGESVGPATAVAAFVLALVQGCDNRDAIKQERRDRAAQLALLEKELTAQVRPIVVPVAGGIRTRKTADGGMDVSLPLKNISQASALALQVTVRLQTLQRGFTGSNVSTLFAFAVPSAEAGTASQPLAAVPGGSTTDVQLHLTLASVYGAQKLRDAARRLHGRFFYRMTATYRDVSGGRWSTVWGLFSLSPGAAPVAVALITPYAVH